MAYCRGVPGSPPVSAAVCLVSLAAGVLIGLVLSAVWKYLGLVLAG
ncbi:MAG TPA: hypothetical protein VFY84_12315 [Jiangellales bacterium]|nr:hypothetical protein [Jiangellales bacterium]